MKMFRYFLIPGLVMLYTVSTGTSLPGEKTFQIGSGGEQVIPLQR